MDDLALPERKALAAALQQHNDEDAFVTKVLIMVDPKKKKAEERILLIGKHRIYTFKPGGKLGEECHMLEIVEVVSPAENQLTIKTKNFVLQMAEPAPQNVENILSNLLASFMGSFQGKANFPFNIQPSDRHDKIKKLATDIIEQQESYCGGFVAAYQAICDQMKISICQDIAWDIDHLYILNDVTTFDLFEISMRQDKLTANDWKALLAALEHNEWFTSLQVSSTKLEKEVFGFIANVFAKNTTIQKLIIKDAGAGRDFFEKLALAFESNAGLSLTYLDFSGNDIEDKGAIALAGALPALKKGLSTLNLSRCGIEKKGMIALAKALEAEHIANSLTSLSLSGNKLDPESCKSLANIITQKIQELNIGATNPDFHLLTGKKSDSLTSIDLSGTKVITKDSKHLDFLRFLSYAPNLHSLKLCGATFPTELIPEILKNIPNIRELDLSDIGLNDSGMVTLVDALKNYPNLKVLNISFNFEKPSKQRSDTIRALITYLNQSNLDTLIFQGNPKTALKTDIVPMIFSLMTNKSLKTLDVTGNQVGNTLALALSKALQVNRTLQNLYWDGNNTSLAGYLMFRSGMHKNRSLIYMPTPSNDINEAIQNSKDKTSFSVQDVIKEIDEIIFKNCLKKRGEIEIDYDDEAEPVKQASPAPVKVTTQTSNSNLISTSQSNLMGSTNAKQATPPAKQPPRPPPKANRPKPTGIDTAHVSALYGQLNDFLTVAQGELTPEEIAEMKKGTK